MRRSCSCLLFLPIGIIPARLEAEPEPSVVRVSSPAGEPGEEVAFDFRADLFQPTRSLLVRFDVSNESAEFLRVDVGGTASAHVRPRGIYYNPKFFQGGYAAGVSFNAQGQRSQIEPGNDLLVFRAVFRVRHDAVPGENQVSFLYVEASTPDAYAIPITIAGEARLTVLEPTRPRPVGDLICSPSPGGVSLSWSLTGEYEAIRVRRDGSPLVELAGTATAHEDAPSPGPRRYEVLAVRGGVESRVLACEVLVEEPRPEPIAGLQCAPSDGGVRLTWSNGQAYDGVEVFRNGQAIADLPGSATSHDDPFRSELFTIYSVRGRKEGIETLPSSCRLNELSDRFLVWVDDVRAEPGQAQVAVRFFVTNPAPLQGMQVALRVDPALARIRELLVEGTASDAAQYDFFAYQRTLDGGETAAGIGFDHTPPFGFLFPPGGDQHFLTLVVDIASAARSGDSIPIELGRERRSFGSPALTCSLTVWKSPAVESLTPMLQEGSILVGHSPVPEIGGALAEALLADGAGAGAGGEAGGAIALSWRNGGAYDGIRVERNGDLLAELPGDRESYLDPRPGPGAHRYRLSALQGGKLSFPAVTWARPIGVPGTFIRGDADGSGAIDLTDAVSIIDHAFHGGPQPGCLDAADADDDGVLGLTDPVMILLHLFLGAEPLPLPGPDAWFDPTADGLSCG